MHIVIPDDIDENLLKDLALLITRAGVADEIYCFRPQENNEKNPNDRITHPAIDTRQ